MARAFAARVSCLAARVAFAAGVASGCGKSAPAPPPSGTLGTIVVGRAGSPFDDDWKRLSMKEADVFYIEDDRADGLMGKVRRTSYTVPATPFGAPATRSAGDAVPSREAISGVIRSNLPNVKTCYLRLTRTGRTISGKAIVSFTVDKEGAVDGVRVDAPSFLDTDLPACVTQQVRRWAFPKSKKGGLAVSYPFVFVAG